MALFDNSRRQNKKVEKVIKELQKKGGNPEAYKTRKSCYNCKYFAPSLSHCNLKNAKTHRAEYCSNFWCK